MEKQVVLYATVPYKNDTSAIVQRIILFCPNREDVTAFIVPYRQKKGRKQTTWHAEFQNALTPDYCHIKAHAISRRIVTSA